MKIIFDKDSTSTPYDNVTTIAVDSENANFPKENLQDDFTTNLWRAADASYGYEYSFEAGWSFETGWSFAGGVLVATITLQVAKGSAVMLSNTNAISATIQIGSGETYVNETGYAYESGYANVGDEISIISTYALPGEGGRLWVDYAEIAVPHTITIELTADSAVSAGIIRAGNVETFLDPALGLGESAIDYSVERELNIGADYYRKRNVVRQFDGLSITDTRAKCWALKHDIFDAVGPMPLAIRLISSIYGTDSEFVAFAKCLESPQIDHISNDYSRIGFTLQEVI